MNAFGRRALATAAALVSLVAPAGCVQDPGGPGTRSDPLPAGVAADIGRYRIAFGPTVPDADALIAAEDPANLPPIAGRRYVVAPLQLTFRGETPEERGEPWLNLDVRYVTRTGEMYGEWEPDQCGTVPGSLEYVDQMPPGTTAFGTVCVAVPADEVAGGVWVARDGGTWGWTGFFTASDAAATGPGSFAEPAAVGAPQAVGPYSVVFGTTRPDALRFLRAWDEETSPPAAGRAFVLAPVTLTFHGGTSSGEPWGDLSFTFVGGDGHSFGQAEADSCGDIPDAVEYAGVLAPERPVTGNVCVSVPREAVAGGRWHVVPEGSALVWTGYAALA